MSGLDIRTRINEIVCEQLCIPSANNDVSLESLGADILDIVELILTINDELDTTIDTNTELLSATINQLTTYIERSIAEKQQDDNIHGATSGR